MQHISTSFEYPQQNLLVENVSSHGHYIEGMHLFIFPCLKYAHCRSWRERSGDSLRLGGWCSLALWDERKESQCATETVEDLKTETSPWRLLLQNQITSSSRSRRSRLWKVGWCTRIIYSVGVCACVCVYSHYKGGFLFFLPSISAALLLRAETVFNKCKAPISNRIIHSALQ